MMASQKLISLNVHQQSMKSPTSIRPSRGNGGKRKTLEQIQFPKNKKRRGVIIRVLSGFQEINSRTELLQLISALTLIQDHAILQLFLQPREIPCQRHTISDMGLPKSFQFCRVLDRFKVVNRGTSEEVALFANCFGDSKRGFISNPDLLVNLVVV